MEQNNNRPNKPENDGKKPRGNIGITLIITVAIVLLISGIFNMVKGSQYTETTYDQFRADMAAGNLEEVEIETDRIIYMTKE